VIDFQDPPGGTRIRTRPPRAPREFCDHLPVIVRSDSTLPSDPFSITLTRKVLLKVVE